MMRRFENLDRTGVVLYAEFGRVLGPAPPPKD